MVFLPKRFTSIDADARIGNYPRMTLIATKI
jgi:hypothetical protein